MVDRYEAAIGIASLVMVMAMGFCGGYGIATDIMEDSAIEHGAARYHPQTGEFEWLAGLDTPPEPATIKPSHAP